MIDELDSSSDAFIAHQKRRDRRIKMIIAWANCLPEYQLHGAAGLVSFRDLRDDALDRLQRKIARDWWLRRKFQRQYFGQQAAE